MTCTFDATLPTNRDWVRSLIGDTDAPDSCVLSDEEIDAFVSEINTEHGTGTHSKYCAAAVAATALSAIALSQSGEVLRKTVGRLTTSKQPSANTQAAYAAHIKSLEARCNALMIDRPRIFESVGKVPHTSTARRVVPGG